MLCRVARAGTGTTPSKSKPDRRQILRVRVEPMMKLDVVNRRFVASRRRKAPWKESIS
jgi:hypothetical protein